LAGSTLGALALIFSTLLIESPPARAQSSSSLASSPSVSLMPSRWNKQHNERWHQKAPPDSAHRSSPPIAAPDATRDMSGPLRPCDGCFEECCAGSCYCENSGGGNPCADCPDACCGDRCCPAPAPPVGCAACDADQCCGDACKPHACGAAEEPAGQCDVDQRACENGCCPADHPYCCGPGSSPFCSATPDCGTSADGGEAALIASPSARGCTMAMNTATAPWPLVLLLLALLMGRRGQLQ
jgi:hypothetical protein